MEVACGQCLGCRLDHSRMWAARIVHESELWDHNCFITLTYRDKEQCTPEQLREGLYVPDDYSLNKVHFQKFMKRLRKSFSDRRIRYYHCGEYGDDNNRPHYHACLFNLDFPDKELFKDNQGNPLFTSELLEEIWGYGFCTIGQLTFESAAYCARYVLKKVSGPQSHDHYTRVHLETGEIIQVQPEYTTMSRRPGIGKEWFDEYKDDLYPSDEVPVPGSGVFKKVPRYYDAQMERSDPETLATVKDARKLFKDENKEEYTPERLMSRYRVKKAQSEMLKRGFNQ